MIEKLTEKQKELMPVIRDKWIMKAITPTNRPVSVIQENIKTLYEMADIEPVPVIVCESIEEFATEIKTFVGSSVWSSVGSSVRSSVWSSVRSSVWSSVESSVGSSVRSSVWSSVGSSVRSSVESSVRSSMRSSVWSSVGSSVRSSVESSVWSSVWSSVESSVGLYYWADDLAYYDFWKSIGIYTDEQNIEKIEKYIDLLSDCSYGFITDKIAIVLTKPDVSVDNDWRLHSLDGMALRWNNGTGDYFIRGVKFSKDQFEKQKNASVTDILAWEDIDQRSVLLRERPLEALLENVPKTLVHHTDECGGYDLYELDLPDIGKAKIMSYKSWSSDKMYAKFVPPDSTDCLETIAKLRHQTVKELKHSHRS